MKRAQSELLRATLLDGDGAREAWDRWSHIVGSPFDALATDAIMARPLLPLIHDSVRRNALPAEERTNTLLRSAYLTESLRSRKYREIVNELTTALEGIEFLLIKGAAVGDLYYDEPALRHAHDVEIAVRLPIAGYQLPAGWQPATGNRQLHQTGLELRIHALPHLFDHTIEMPSGVRTIDATAALQLALARASRTQRWACDACMIIRRARIYWRRIRDARVSLRWLRDMLQLDIPPEKTIRFLPDWLTLSLLP